MGDGWHVVARVSCWYIHGARAVEGEFGLSVSIRGRQEKLEYGHAYQQGAGHLKHPCCYCCSIGGIATCGILAC